MKRFKVPSAGVGRLVGFPVCNQLYCSLPRLPSPLPKLRTQSLLTLSIRGSREMGKTSHSGKGSIPPGEAQE